MLSEGRTRRDCAVRSLTWQESGRERRVWARRAFREGWSSIRDAGGQGGAGRRAGKGAGGGGGQEGGQGAGQGAPELGGPGARRPQEPVLTYVASNNHNSLKI